MILNNYTGEATNETEKIEIWENVQKNSRIYNFLKNQAFSFTPP